jgi:hypothetical protein
MRFTGLCNHIQIAGALQPDLDRPLFCSSILSYLLPPILFRPLLFRSSAEEEEEEEEMTGFLVIALLLCLLGAANMVRRSGTLSGSNPAIPPHYAEHHARS